MDIKEKVTIEQKNQMRNLMIEISVLDNLLKERKAMLQETGVEIITKAGLSPKTYNLRFNSGKDIWDAELKDELKPRLVLPGQETRPAMKAN